MKNSTIITLCSIALGFVFWIFVPMCFVSSKKASVLYVDDLQTMRLDDVASVWFDMDQRDEDDNLKYQSYTLDIHIVVSDSTKGVEIAMPRHIISMKRKRSSRHLGGSELTFTFTSEFRHLYESSDLIIASRQPIGDSDYDATIKGYDTRNIPVTLKMNQAKALALINRRENIAQKLLPSELGEITVTGLRAASLDYHNDCTTTFDHCQLREAVIDMPFVSCQLEHTTIGKLRFHVSYNEAEYQSSALSTDNASHVGQLLLTGQGSISLRNNHFDHIIYEPSDKETLSITLDEVDKHMTLK